MVLVSVRFRVSFFGLVRGLNIHNFTTESSQELLYRGIFLYLPDYLFVLLAGGGLFLLQKAITDGFLHYDTRHEFDAELFAADFAQQFYALTLG